MYVLGPRVYFFLFPPLERNISRYTSPYESEVTLPSDFLRAISVIDVLDEYIYELYNPRLLYRVVETVPTYSQSCLLCESKTQQSESSQAAQRRCGYNYSQVFYQRIFNMNSLRLVNRICQAQRGRFIATHPALRDSKSTSAVKTSSESASNATQKSTPKETPIDSNIFGPRWVVPTKRDRRMLVWLKYYKSVDEVPNKMTYEKLDKAQNKARIKICTYMMIATFIGCYISLYWGKKRAERGESVEKWNEDWHNKINAEYQESLKKKALAENKE
ncbi:uncharacterized protein LOC124409946 [Diprion similis]|uniref:uncharacterized protein LOC124409946 n=1 Tax=Diprion similis TaxID=362088 RepID=UPI001EF7C47E|nr:uncharacterized protein LOC124409946 [Diprion similis]